MIRGKSLNFFSTLNKIKKAFSHTYYISIPNDRIVETQTSEIALDDIFSLFRTSVRSPAELKPPSRLLV